MKKNNRCLQNKLHENKNVKNGYIRPVVWRGSEMMAISALKPPQI